MMDTDLIIKMAIVIVGLLFNVYAANVLTNYNKVESTYSSDSNLPYKERQSIRNKYRHNRDITLLTFGILMLITAVLTPTHTVKIGLGLAGVLTIFYSAIINWSSFDDRYRLFIVTFALIFLCYSGIKVIQ